VIVSDLHIGGSEAPFFNKRSFHQFIQTVLKSKEKEISHFIMLGDVIDLWWKPTKEVVQESSDLMLELSNPDMKKYYLIGNHDFDLKNIYPLDLDFEIAEGISSTKLSTGNGIKYDSTLRSGERDFRFIHGHQIPYWHALPFYEVFCKAMCGRMDTKPIANLWDTILANIETSQYIRTEIMNLSNRVREKLEYYLAGPLELGPEDEPKSVLEEWELLRGFEDRTRIQSILKDSTLVGEVIREIEEIAKVLNIHNEMSSHDTEKLLDTFAEIWREILQKID
jgi:hypothetical protein